jgi:hypothetical protein
MMINPILQNLIHSHLEGMKVGIVECQGCFHQFVTILKPNCEIIEPCRICGFELNTFMELNLEQIKQLIV